MKLQSDHENEEAGKRIKAIRLRSGLNQEQFGKKFGVSKGGVSRWESGNTLPNAKRLQNIADFANVSVNSILYGSFQDKINVAADCCRFIKQGGKFSEITTDDKYSVFDEEDFSYLKECTDLINQDSYTSVPKSQDNFEAGLKFVAKRAYDLSQLHLNLDFTYKDAVLFMNVAAKEHFIGMSAIDDKELKEMATREVKLALDLVNTQARNVVSEKDSKINSLSGRISPSFFEKINKILQKCLDDISKL